MRRIGCAHALWGLIALVLTAGAAGATTVERIRYSSDNAHTRIVLDTSGRCDYRIARHESPERITINLRGAGASRALRNLHIGKGGIQRVRINRLSWGTQIVLDLETRVDWDDFRLASSGSRPDRIVVDITPRAATSPGGGGLIIVAVDPGHGGKDPGAIGRGNIVEKRMTLDIARRVARRINVQKGFKAVLTRTRDEYLTLPRRTEIASEKGADVFVSIHLNTARNRAARGTEIYFVSPSGAARSASKVLSDPTRAASQYGLDRNDGDILHMLVDMNQQAVLARSEALGESILQEMSRPGLMPTRTVKQKSFSVLRTIEMPSVLIEVGFISNASDAKLIRSESGRDAVADAIGDGIVRFLRANPPQRKMANDVVVHHVRRGETLWQISQRYGTSVTSLRETNQLGRSSVLRVGQELVITKRY